MKRLILEADFDYDFELMALVTPLRDYRLCWILNKLLQFDFERKKDLEIHYIQQKKLIFFSIFSYYDALDKITHFIISNKSNNDILIPEIKQADYFLMSKGTLTDEDRSIMNEKIKNIPSIQTLFGVDPYSLKSKQNLIFDESDL